MNRLTYLLFSFFYLAACQGQLKPFKIIDKKNTNERYQQFIVTGDNILALTTSGKLAAFNISTGDVLPEVPLNDSAITILTKDKTGTVIIADKIHLIKQLDNKAGSWKTIGNYKKTLWAIGFDSKNDPYYLTGKGIYDPRTKQYYFPDSSLNKQITYSKQWFGKPVYFMDKEDNMWVGFGYGEWGGDLFIFNTKTKKWIIPAMGKFDIELRPIKSIFAAGDDVIVTAGLMHMSMTGAIARFNNFVATIIFQSEEHLEKSVDTANQDHMIQGEYIGPGAFNSNNNLLYFYSQNGFFEGNYGFDLSTIEHWKPLFRPVLHWSNGQPDAVGSPMNVLQLNYVKNGTIIFLSQLDGIGIYNGMELIMVQ